ncbi:MAG: bifunctional hydroxymethylpyrimidine kinase/phosphomethylpyrimidine kinase [Deltaproteobacteria bacterium]|nr:bifunctional hydroxymethylpyrimidine kinase/phosphomethylpyrimidine kinase [Deltaproteobacteria bacterium]
MSLLVVGSVALDSVLTPSDERNDILGGSASFFSAVSSLLGPVRLVAVVGDDFPEEHVQFLAERGVDIEGLQRATGRTFRWKGRYLDDMVSRETLDTQLNVFESFKPQLPKSYADSDFVFLANIDPHLQRDVLDQIDKPRFVALDTMNFWLRDHYLDVLKDVLKRVDVVFLNDEEASMLSGRNNLVAAAAAIRDLGVPRVIIKRGDAGAMLFDEEGIFLAPAFPLENVVDPTGAGDSFAAGFMAYLAHKADQRAITAERARQALIFGSASASFAVEDFSVDRFRTLELNQVVERCAGFSRLVRFSPVEI